MIAAPTIPDAGESTVSSGVTVKLESLLPTPVTVTATDVPPGANPFGTITAILVSVQLLTAAMVFPNVTVLVPWLEPKSVPVRTTDIPNGPESGDRLVTLGVGRTVKLGPLLLLGTPFTVTTTVPVVAVPGTDATICVSLQLLTIAGVPLKVMVLLTCAAPKLLPTIVMVAPNGPAAGDKFEMTGVGSTAKLSVLLAALFTVTTRLPVSAPTGTGTTICVAVQLLGVATMPLNVTVLVP